VLVSKSDEDRPLADELKAAGAERQAARQKLKRADTVEARTAALIRLGEAEERYTKALDASRQKANYVVRTKAPSKRQRRVSALEHEVRFLHEGLALIKAGVELAETEDSLEDWLDEARDYLEQAEGREELL
jgi:hypothetical protein